MGALEEPAAAAWPASLLVGPSRPPHFGGSSRVREVSPHDVRPCRLHGPRPAAPPSSVDRAEPRSPGAAFIEIRNRLYSPWCRGATEIFRSASVVRAVRAHVPEALVGDGEGVARARVGKPRREEAVTVAAVVHAAGVEPAQARRDVEALQRPVPVDDAVVVAARAPTPRATARRPRSWSGASADQPPSASALRHETKRPKFASRPAQRRGERRAVGRGEPGLRLARGRERAGAAPGRRHRRVHHQEGAARRARRRARAAAGAANRTTRPGRGARAGLPCCRSARAGGRRASGRAAPARGCRARAGRGRPRRAPAPARARGSSSGRGSRGRRRTRARSRRRARGGRARGSLRARPRSPARRPRRCAARPQL